LCTEKKKRRTSIGSQGAMSRKKPTDEIDACIQFTCFHGTNSAQTSIFSRFGFPLIIFSVWALIIPLQYGICYLTGKAYENLLYEKEEDRDPSIWAYEGWILVIIFFWVLAYADLAYTFGKKRFFTPQIYS
jgi:hypothetical protein